MQTKTTLHYYKPGDFYKLETTLDAMSQAGWQAYAPGRLVQRYQLDHSQSYHYRFGYCNAKPGTAKEIVYLSSQSRAGWEIAARNKCWILFKKPQSIAEPEEHLVGGREPITALFDKQIKHRETFRMWMIVLASLLLIAGYAADQLYIIYAFALPMLAALLVTLQIKYMVEGLKH